MQIFTYFVAFHKFGLPNWETTVVILDWFLGLLLIETSRKNQSNTNVPIYPSLFHLNTSLTMNTQFLNYFVVLNEGGLFSYIWEDWTLEALLKLWWPWPLGFKTLGFLGWMAAPINVAFGGGKKCARLNQQCIEHCLVMEVHVPLVPLEHCRTVYDWDGAHWGISKLSSLKSFKIFVPKFNFNLLQLSGLTE